MLNASFGIIGRDVDVLASSHGDDDDDEVASSASFCFSSFSNLFFFDLQIEFHLFLTALSVRPEKCDAILDH